ncbi:MAG: L-aspartate oxidase [Eubacteriales bacterium]
MKRYTVDSSLNNIKTAETDVVIVGCGAAGLYAALNLDPGLKCIILNKAGIKHSNSMYAQGGVATVIQPNEFDNTDQHFNDTIVAGAGLCDEKAVSVLVSDAWSNIEQLVKIGVPFDTNNGSFRLTKEGGHGQNRILHCGGDATGLYLTKSLYEAAAKRDNICIINMIFLTDILTDENGVCGVVTLNAQNELCRFSASKVIIASGGIGHVYRNSTNAICATGDGIAAAYRAGAELKDMEFVQFHPTSFIHPHENGRYFLISEALRGEGAILKNRRGESFMRDVHPLADLAPRDIVSRAIIMEMQKSDIPNVYLDITAKSRYFLKERFPTIYGECMLRGVDIAKDWIPVIPVQHYFMGGIKTDIDGRTNISGLYACGEAACTGVHGANRLASNSLLECLVFGRRCAKHINGSDIFSAKSDNIDYGTFGKTVEGVDFDSYINEIRNLSTKKCGIIRNDKDLKTALGRVDEIFEELDTIELNNKKEIETYNRSQIASLIILASIKRKKSVGAHFRNDDENLKENNDVK